MGGWRVGQIIKKKIPLICIWLGLNRDVGVGRSKPYGRRRGVGKMNFNRRQYESATAMCSLNPISGEVKKNVPMVEFLCHI